MLMGANKTQRTASALTFFRATTQRWRISQSHRNRWWNLGFICECWHQRAVKAMDTHIHQTSQKSLNKRCLLCQKADGNCFLDQKSSADSGIHATRDHNNVRSVFRNTKKYA
jgi:hypothetical protein